MVLLNTIINKGFDGGLLIQGLAKHVRNVLMAKDPQTLPLLEVSDQQRQRYAEQAKKADTRFLYQALRLMNQCDINYRQSSNKRLLVELTLIEVAQITQPDDGASAGRRPKRLKSLFKKLIQQSQPKTVAPQVATAKTVASTPASPKIQASQETKTAQEPKTSQEPQTTQEPQATQKPQASPAKPATQGLKLGGIGFSWNRLRNQGKPSKINSIPNSISHAIEQQTDAAFTQEDLELQWMSMCVRMPQEYQGIATRMKNMNPVIVESPQIEVMVDNDLIKQEMEDFKGRIVSTLKQSLHNNNITLSIQVAKQKERVKIMTRREQFDMMREKNPAVEALRQAFDLELA